jgi:hypothetical protein
LDSSVSVNPLAAHLQRLDTNERAEVKQLRGVAAQDLDGALDEMEAVALGSRSKRHFYHASINTRADELLTPEQWTRAVDRLEKELGLDDQPRAVVFHLKEGRAHVHVVWSRIDLETMTAIPDSHNFRRHEIVSRELEREFGHNRVQGVHVERDGQPRPDRTPSHAEMQQGNRSRVSPEQATSTLTAIWQQADSGKAFISALEGEGWRLARGDRRDFVSVDPHGGVHSLSRRIEGARAADVRAKLADIDPQSLPTVTQAQVLVAAAAAKQETTAHTEAVSRTEPVKLSENPTAQAIRAALAKSSDGIELAAALEDRGLAFAVVGPEEAAKSHRVAAFARATGRWARSYAEGEIVVVNTYGAVTPLSQRVTGKATDELAPILASVDRAPLMDIATTRSAMQEAGRAAFMDERAAARPQTAVEQAIIAASRSAGSGVEFMALIGAEGLTLARITAEDARAIRAGVDPDAVRLQRLGEGDLVAVNRFGGVHRLNPHHVDYGLCQALMSDLERSIPGAVGLEGLQATRSFAVNEALHVSDVWATERLDRATQPNRAIGLELEGRIPPKDQIKVAGAVDVVFGVAAKAAEVMGDIASGIAGIFAPEGPPTPEAIENRIDKAQRIEAEQPRIEAMTKAEREEAERLAAIQKAQADMESALRDDDDRDRDDWGYERSR